MNYSTSRVRWGFYFLYESFDPDDGAEDGVEAGVDGFAVEEDDESELPDELVLDSLLVDEELESLPPPSLCELDAPLSCFPPASALGFDKLGSFNLFE